MKDENLKIYVSDTIGVSDRNRIGFTHHQTNRSAVHHDSQHPTKATELDTLIRKFVETRTTDTTELEKFLLPLAQDFSTQLHTTKKTYFRGLSDSIEVKLQCDRIGPSPDPGDNRYSVKGEKCLYLIDDKEFLSKELKTSSLLIQEYDNIPFDSIRLADLSSENTSLDNSLALVFQWAESGKTALGYRFEEELREKGKSVYLVSQLLAACFKKEGWDGIYVPGIHGESGKHYHNLSIFGAKIANWWDWTTCPCYRGGGNGYGIGQ